MTAARRPAQGRRRRFAPRGLLVTLALVLASVGGCDLAGPSPSSPSPAASPTGPSATFPSAGPKASATPRSSPTPRPLPSPSASAPRIVGATQTPCPGSTTTARRGSVTTGQSRNWAGYIVGVTKGHVTCVEGTWTQPKVRCPSSGQTSVAIWVGIDGSSAVGTMPDASATLAQTGTTGDCDDGKATYGAWFEFLPDLRQITPLSVPVNGGDTIWARVLSLGKGRFVATLVNVTQLLGATQAWTLRQPPLLTAEWVVEDPAASCSGSSCTFMTLSRFPTVTLNGAVTINGRRYPLRAVPFPYLRTSINRSGKTLASPTWLTSRGFSVTWKSS